MTPLERALRDRIQTEGPLTVEAYMDACNSYYYATHDPLGASGDFTTAPEITQMFGELVGATLADCWARTGKPDATLYVELGPGRGTLASDALRVMRSAQLSPPVHLVETSPALRSVQAGQIAGAHWHDDFDSVPDGPLLVVANEFLDALPIRQFVGGVERRIVAAAGGLAFDRDGLVVEDSPVRESAVRKIAGRLAQQGGVALLVDYGHPSSAPGDTLQAVARHRYAPVLDKPGEQDLTAHVDFESVARTAIEAGAEVSPVVEQGEWLKRVGIQSRARALAGAHPDRAGEIEQAVERLCHPGQMGKLFKVIAIRSNAWPLPAGFE
jgi:SAM-dependent MidA family methyltransferase